MVRRYDESLSSNIRKWVFEQQQLYFHTSPQGFHLTGYSGGASPSPTGKLVVSHAFRDSFYALQQIFDKWIGPLRRWPDCLPPGGRGTTKWWKEPAGVQVKHVSLHGTIVYLSLSVIVVCSPHPPLRGPPSPLGKALIVDFRLFGFGGMPGNTVGRGLAPAAKNDANFIFASFCLFALNCQCQTTKTAGASPRPTS